MKNNNAIMDVNNCLKILKFVFEKELKDHQFCNISDLRMYCLNIIEERVGKKNKKSLKMNVSLEWSGDHYCEKQYIQITIGNVVKMIKIHFLSDEVEDCFYRFSVNVAAIFNGETTGKIDNKMNKTDFIIKETELFLPSIKMVNL